MSFKEKYNMYVDMVNSELKNILPSTHTMSTRVCEAMKYSLMAGGKRIRPVLTLSVCEMFGCDIQKAIPFACAVEFIHVGSLIHDDLPCMDDDDLRRGQPSCHIKYDEATAVLAGDGLFFSAFEILLLAKKFGVNESDMLKACDLLSKMSGIDGMVGGQVMDMFIEKNGADESMVEVMQQRKTAALIQAACCLGGVAAGVNDNYFEILNNYALSLGLAFQVCDDVLDVTGTENILGKPVGSDIEENKVNSVSLLGLEKAKMKAKKYTENAISELNKLPNNQFLMNLTKFLLNRDH